MALKANGEWQPCGDYRWLNLASVLDRYSIPHILDFTAGLARCSVFSKNQFSARIPPGPGPPRRCPQDSCDDPFRPLGVAHLP